MTEKCRVVLFIQIKLFGILNINTKMHAYVIDYYCYCLCIVGHKFYYFVYSIENLREEQGKWIFLFNWMKFSYYFTNYIFYMDSPSYCIALINYFFDSTKNCQKQKGKIFFNECNFSMIRLIKYFWCTHLHTVSLSLIVSSVQSNIVNNRKAR